MRIHQKASADTKGQQVTFDTKFLGSFTKFQLLEAQR